jgi:hypothetical protein
VIVRLATVPVLAVLLGCCTALSFLLVGGRLALAGPYVLERMWHVIYPLEAAIVGVVMVIVGWMLRGRGGILSLVVIVLAAWIGELLILGSGLIDDDAAGLTAVPLWVLATGGPLQPIAAIIGGLVGARLPSRLQRRPSNG